MIRLINISLVSMNIFIKNREEEYFEKGEYFVRGEYVERREYFEGGIF